MRPANLIRAGLLPAVAALALAACASRPDIRPCPPIGSPAGLERVTVFAAGGGEKLTEMVYEARVDVIDSLCQYDAGALAIALNVRLVAERGPADSYRRADFRYFVAVEEDVGADGMGSITAKAIYEVALPFDGERRRVGTVEEIDIAVPAPAEGGFADIRILVGLQITPLQVEYNRRRRGR